MKTMVIRDANVYVNGTSTHGYATEVALPNIDFSKSEYKALGLNGVLKLFNGFNAMESTVKWSSPDNDVAKVCLNPFTPVSLMIRSSRDVYEGGVLTAQEPVIFYVKGTPSGMNPGTLKSKEDNETESRFDLTYFKEVIKGEEIVEIDVANNIFVVGGEDLLKTYRENLGL